MNYLMIISMVSRARGSCRIIFSCLLPTFHVGTYITSHCPIISRRERMVSKKSFNITWIIIMVLWKGKYFYWIFKFMLYVVQLHTYYRNALLKITSCDAIVMYSFKIGNWNHDFAVFINKFCWNIQDRRTISTQVSKDLETWVWFNSYFCHANIKRRLTDFLYSMLKIS